jgi:hypothetical protein
MIVELERVIVCQLGAREHYAAPRILHRAGVLSELVTDVWIPPESGLSHVPGRVGARLRDRYDVELSAANVTHFTASALGREAKKIVSRRESQWDETIAQNRWFQAQTVRHLRANRTLEGKGAKPIVLAYSYAAREILVYARNAGARTILGQIDGGEADEALISALWSERLETMPNKAPGAYWAEWRQECHLSDRIIVNSEWSRELLIRAGVETGKLMVVPVIYEHKGLLADAHRYPRVFDETRPLRVLFLGALTLRKGVLETLEAARQLTDLPIQFMFIGGDHEARASDMVNLPNITRHDRVPRSQVLQRFKNADVFLFPTHSDGFGMTQIEALGNGLPVISSRNCATVVEHGKTGFLLQEVTASEIARAIVHCLNHPDLLAEMSAAAYATSVEFARESSAKLLTAINEFAALERR